MSGASLLLSLFRHKAWANDELFDGLAKLDPVAHSAERHAAVRLLNHLHVVDQIFAAHLRGGVHRYTATNTEETPSLEALQHEVVVSDRWYIGRIASLAPHALAESIDFVFADGQPGRMTREEILVHVATHGSYHRGAVGRIMTVLGVAPPRDLLTVYLHQFEPQRRAPLQ